MNLYKIACRNIGRNRRRSILSGSAVAIASSAIVFLFGLMGGMLNDMKNNIWTYFSGAVRIRHAGFDKYERLNPMHLNIPNYEGVLETILEESEAAVLSPRINFPALIPRGGISSKQKFRATGQGVDFGLEVDYQNYSETLIEGRLPKMGTRETVLGRALASKLGVSIGDKFTVLSRSGTRGSNAFTFTVTGLLQLPMAGMDGTLFQIPLDTAQRFLWLPGQVQEILVKVDTDSSINPKAMAAMLKAKIESSVPLSVKHYKEVNGMASMMEMAVRVYDLIAIVVFLLASTVIINTTIMVIFERMREIGTLAALGMTRAQLVKLFFYEAITICVIGSFIGIAIGIAITGYLGKVGFSAMADALKNLDASAGFGSTIYPVLNFKSTVLVFVYSLLVTALATWWPSRRAAKIAPVDALRQA